MLLAPPSARGRSEGTLDGVWKRRAFPDVVDEREGDKQGIKASADDVRAKMASIRAEKAALFITASDLP